MSYWKSDPPMEPAARFRPHNFKNLITFPAGMPQICLSQRAYSKLVHIAHIAQEHTSFVGLVQESGKDFIVDEIRILNQEIGYTKSEFTNEDLSCFIAELAQDYQDRDAVSQLRMWGVTRGEKDAVVTKDNLEQFMIFSEIGHPYTLLAVMNRYGKLSFSIYFNELGVIVEDAEWYVGFEIDEHLRDEIKEEYADKVKEKSYTSTTYNYGSGSSWNTGVKSETKSESESKTEKKDKEVVFSESDFSLPKSAGYTDEYLSEFEEYFEDEEYVSQHDMRISKDYEFVLVGKEGKVIFIDLDDLPLEETYGYTDIKSADTFLNYQW